MQALLLARICDETFRNGKLRHAYFRVINASTRLFFFQGLGMAALYYLETQYYLYYNRVGDVMTMVGVMGGLLASFHLLLLYFCGCKTMSGQLLLLLMYGFLNTVMGILLLVEILNYDLCKNYLLMAILVKSLGIVMLFDFLRTYHYQCVCYPTSCSVCKKKRGPKSEPNPARRYYFCTNICRKCSCFEMNKSY